MPAANDNKPLFGLMDFTRPAPDVVRNEPETDASGQHPHLVHVGHPTRRSRGRSGIGKP